MPAAIESLGERMAVISERRGPVIGFSLLVWLASSSGAALGAARGAPPGRECGSPGSASSICRCCCCSAPRSNRAREPNSCW